MKDDETTTDPGELTPAEIEEFGRWREQHNITFPPCTGAEITLTGPGRQRRPEPEAVLVSAWPVRENSLSQFDEKG